MRLRHYEADQKYAVLLTFAHFEGWPYKIHFLEKKFRSSRKRLGHHPTPEWNVTVLTLTANKAANFYRDSGHLSKY